ncbi:hypothetical protein [Methylobacterium komagatae]
MQASDAPAPDPQRRVPSTLGNAALGLTQIILWGGSFFLTAVIVGPVVESTGWPQGLVIGSLSLAILISGLLSPWIGTQIRRFGGRPVLVAGTLVMALGLVLMAMAGNLAVFSPLGPSWAWAWQVHSTIRSLRRSARPTAPPRAVR